MEDYRTIHGTATGEYEEKKSRFIAALSFADSEEAAVAFLEQVRAANRRSSPSSAEELFIFSAYRSVCGRSGMPFSRVGS